MKPKVAIVISHPVQHFCPQFTSYAKNNAWDTKVFFASAIGYKPYFDANFNSMISWGNIDVNSFEHCFLNGEQTIPVTRNIDSDKLDEALSEYNPEVVITYGYIQKLQRHASKWAISNHKKLFFISDAELRHKRSFWIEALKNILVRFYLRNVDIFLTVGDNNEAYYRKYGVPDKKFIRMHFPIDVNLYEQCYQQHQKLNTSLRRKYNIGDNELVLSVVGKLVSWKNQVDVINALIELEKRNFCANLFIIGTGIELKTLKSQSLFLKRSKVHFPGFIQVNDLPAYYAMSDIYIHPAKIEPHSLSVSEAIYMGKPAIVSDNTGSWGPTDDVIPGKNGTIYKTCNINALANAILELGQNRDKMNAFGRESHELAVKYQALSHGQGLRNALEYSALLN